MHKQHLNIVFHSIAISILFPVLGNLTHLSFTGLGFVIAIFTLLWLLISHNNAFKPVIKSPASTWFLLMLYHLMNLMLNHDPNINLHEFITKNIFPALVLFLCTFLGYYDYKCFVKRIVYVYLIFIIFSTIVFLRGMTYDFGGGRIGILGFHPNILGQYAGYYCLLLSIYSILFKPTYLKIGLMLIAPIALIICCESRNSLLIFVFAVISYLTGYYIKNKTDLSTIIKTIGIFVIICGSIMYAVQNTALGGRVSDGLSGDAMAVRTEYETGTIFDLILGERIMYYVIGFEILPDNLIFGIGLWNFMKYNIFEMPFHSEYMVHLVEGGIIGFTLYIIFIGRIVKLFIAARHRDAIYYQLLICFLCLMANSITARIFPYNHFFPVFGLIIGYLESQKKI